MFSPELLNAYRKAIYEVYQPYFILRVDFQPPTTLKKLLQTHRQSTWAFITPYNPYSTVLSEAENALRWQAFLQKINAFPYYLGEGKDPKGIWRPEKSALIIGISSKEALLLAQRFQQNAFLWGREAQAVALVSSH